MSESIVPFDWGRLLWGAEPFGFYFEIVFRSLVMYVVLLLLLRSLSKRALTQLSILEFGIVIAMGSAAGDPTFYKEIPLLQAILVLLTLICIQIGYTWLLNRSETFENAMEGKPVELIEAGRIRVEALERARISQGELFELLRMKGLQQLGEIRKAYLEQNGQISVFRFEQPRPGLAFVPPWELEPPQPIQAGQMLADARPLACRRCGAVGHFAAGALPDCGCGHSEFHAPSLDPLGLGQARER